MRNKYPNAAKHPLGTRPGNSCSNSSTLPPNTAESKLPLLPRAFKDAASPGLSPCTSLLSQHIHMHDTPLLSAAQNEQCFAVSKSAVYPSLCLRPLHFQCPLGSWAEGDIPATRAPPWLPPGTSHADCVRDPPGSWSTAGPFSHQPIILFISCEAVSFGKAGLVSYSLLFLLPLVHRKTCNKSSLLRTLSIEPTQTEL